MDNNFPQNNLPNNNQSLQKPTVWVSNPNLKILLGVLIFVFLGCGIGLVIFAQWGSMYREKVYEETQAGLPKHQVKQSQVPTTLADGRLQVDEPKEGDTLGNTFTVSGYAQDWFEGNIVIKVFDSKNKQLYQGNTIAGDNYGHPAPFTSQITLLETPTSASGRVEFNDYSAKDGKLVYQKVINIKFANEITAGWKTYKNDQYGFEFQYPAEWKLPKVGGNLIQLGCPDSNIEGDLKCRLSLSVEQSQNEEAYIKTLQLMSYENDVGEKFNQNGPSLQDFQVNGFKASTYHDAGLCTDTYTVFFGVNNNLVFSDHCDIYQSNGVYNKIVQTFKFTN